MSNSTIKNKYGEVILLSYPANEERKVGFAGATPSQIADQYIQSNAAAAYGQLALAQIYQGTSWNGAPDRNIYDGGINRSDNAAFHQQG